MPDMANAKSTLTRDSKSPDSSGGPAVSLDQLNYMADLLVEMQVMAVQSRLDTLAVILGLAVGEANQQIAKLRC